MVLWWDDAKIDATVTRQFVCQHLLPEEIERLDRSLAFGGGLTDGTYWEWIDGKAKRIFMILLDLGVPDQIFGIIDDSWDDHDLPIPQEHVERLALTAVKDDKIERKFYLRQYYYLLKPLQKGQHTVFTDQEVVPLDLVERRPGLAGSHAVDKVTLPNYHPNQIFCRRRIPLGTGIGCLSQEELLDSVNNIKGVQNDHLVSYFASYVHQGSGYVLFTPASDTNLKSFLATTPSSFKNLSKKDRRGLVINWILCLADSLAYIHARRLSHGNIKPSTILFNNQHHIFYSDFTRLNSETLSGGTADKNSFDRESYDYAAPEQWFRPTSGPTSPISRKATLALSSSPETHTSFSIPRNENPSSPNAMLQTPNPHLNPQSADVFSLGCIMLEMLSFLLKKSSKGFATHRAAKHKTPGRGGAVLDSSFHKNLGQVEAWMSTLAKEASKKSSDSDGGVIFRGIVPMLHIVARMLSANPNDRPAASEVQHRVYQILTEYCAIKEPHCVHQYGGWDFGVAQLRIQGTTPNGDAMSIPKAPKRNSGTFSPRALVHSRTNSSGGFSNSGASSTASSEKDRDLGAGFAGLRNIRVPKKPESERQERLWATTEEPEAGSE